MMGSRVYLGLMERWAAHQTDRGSVVGAVLMDGICGGSNER